MELTVNYIVITGLLIIAGLFLEKWQPPIKKQYIAMVLFTLGGCLGYYVLDTVCYGILISGLVYYKKELVEEVVEIVQSFKGIKDEIDDVK